MSEPVRIEGAVCKAQTTRAILVEIDEHEIWIPQSQVHEDSEVYHKGDQGTLVISEWIATQKGLI
jgi:hypothetical protein